MIKLNDRYPSVDSFLLKLIRNRKRSADEAREAYQTERLELVPILVKKSSLNISLISSRIYSFKLKDIVKDSNSISNASSVDIIVYLSGGAFAVVENSDMWIMERLLPLLGEEGSATKAYSIIYESDSRVVNGEGESLFGTVRQELLTGFENVFEHAFGSFDALKRQKVRLMFMGTSAGGNLALNYIPYLEAELKEKYSTFFNSSEVTIKLCSSSPWVDLFATEASPYFIQQERNDFLNPNLLNHGRDNYILGLPQYESIVNASRKFEALLFSKVFTVEISQRKINTAVFDLFDCLDLASNGTCLNLSKLDDLIPEDSDLALALRALNIDIKLLVNSPASQDTASNSNLGCAKGGEYVKTLIVHFSPSDKHDISLSTETYDQPKPSFLSKLYQFLFGAFIKADQSETGVIVFSKRNKGILDPKNGFTFRHAIAWIRENYRDSSSLVPDPTQALDAVLEELVDKHMDDILTQATAGLSEKDRVILGFVNPLMAKNEVLASLPTTLILAGEKELFFEQILLYYKRLQRAQKAKKVESSLVVATNGIHGFAGFWRHPFHRMFDAKGLGWLFYWLHPHRYYAWRSYGRRRIPSDRFVHSLNADRALQIVADFFVSPSK